MPPSPWPYCSPDATTSSRHTSTPNAATEPIPNTAPARISDSVASRRCRVLSAIASAGSANAASPLRLTQATPRRPGRVLAGAQQRAAQQQGGRERLGSELSVLMQADRKSGDSNAATTATARTPVSRKTQTPTRIAVTRSASAIRHAASKPVMDREQNHPDQIHERAERQRSRERHQAVQELTRALRDTPSEKSQYPLRCHTASNTSSNTNTQATEASANSPAVPSPVLCLGAANRHCASICRTTGTTSARLPVALPS